MTKKKPQPKKVTKDSAEPKTAIGPPLGMPILDHTEGKAIVVPGAIEKLNERVRARPKITDVTIANMAASLRDHPEDWEFSDCLATHIVSNVGVWLWRVESRVHLLTPYGKVELEERPRKMLWEAGRPHVEIAKRRTDKVEAAKIVDKATKAFGQ